MSRADAHPEECQCGGVGWLDSDTPCPGPIEASAKPTGIAHRHHSCRWCGGSGWIETSRERQEVARCPGDRASQWDIANLRHRAEEGHRRHMDEQKRSVRGEGVVTGPPPDFGPQVLEALEANRARHAAALEDRPALPQPEPEAVPEPAEPEEETQLFDPDQI